MLPVGLLENVPGVQALQEIVLRSAYLREETARRGVVGRQDRPRRAGIFGKCNKLRPRLLKVKRCTLQK